MSIKCRKCLENIEASEQPSQLCKYCKPWSDVSDLEKKFEIVMNALEEAGNFTACQLDNMEHYFDNKCIPTMEEVNQCAIADSYIRLAIAKVRGKK